MLAYNKNLKQLSRNLRNNMTDAERKLWSILRLRQLNGYRFLRQKIIGNYIVDFYCPEIGIIIEVDGSQHYTETGIIADKKRAKYLSELGFKVLRFNDNEVLTNIEGVVEVILGVMGNL